VSGVPGHIAIGGDVPGQVIAGDHNIVISATGGSRVTPLKPGELPRPVQRDPITLLPRRRPVPIGRNDELDRLAGSMAPGGQAEVYGPPGIGKTTLVSHLAHQLAERGDPVVFLNAAGRDLEDLLQDLFESCFDSTGYRPSAVELRRLMSGLRFSLILDDLDVADDELAALLEAAPDAWVVRTRVNRSLWEGPVVALGGLSRSAGMSLIERQLDRPLRDDEAHFVDTVWDLTEGRPMDIIQTIAVAERSPDGSVTLPLGTSLLQARTQKLDVPARRILSLLAALGPVAVTPDLLSAMLPDLDVHKIAERLLWLGLATIDDNGYRPAPGTAADFAENLVHDSDELTSVTANTMTWLSTTAATPQTAGTNGPALARLTSLATAGGHPDLACELARAAAPVVGRSLRWGSWRAILERGAKAAEQAGNAEALAYFTHEDDIAAAGPALRQARRRVRRASLIVVVVAAVAVLAVLGLSWPGFLGHPNVPAATPAFVPSGSSAGTVDPNVNNHGVEEPVRRHDLAVITAGKVIDVDSLRGDWGLGEAPKGSPYDLEFASAHRTLEGVSPTIVGLLPSGSVGTRRECGRLRAYGDPVQPTDLRSGALICEIDDDHRFALLRVINARHDDQGMPDQLTLDITVWEPQDAS
jgi:hypothetical protein